MGAALGMQRQEFLSYGGSPRKNHQGVVNLVSLLRFEMKRYFKFYIAGDLSEACLKKTLPKMFEATEIDDEPNLSGKPKKRKMHRISNSTWVETEFQIYLHAYLEGKLSERSLLRILKELLDNFF